MIWAPESEGYKRQNATKAIRRECSSTSLSALGKCLAYMCTKTQCISDAIEQVMLVVTMHILATPSLSDVWTGAILTV